MDRAEKQFLEQIQSLKGKKIVFWGASLFLKNFLQNNSVKDYNIVGIADKNRNRWGDIFEGYEIFSPKRLTDLGEVYVIFAVYSDLKNIYLHVQDEINILKEYNNKITFVHSQYVNDINTERIKKLTSNKIYIIDSDGNRHLANYIEGLQVEWLSENSVIEIGGNPLPKFVNCKITCSRNNKIFIDSSQYKINNLTINMPEVNTKLHIGRNLSTIQTRLSIKEPNCSITIGDNCMFAAEIIVRCEDSHVIFDKTTKKVLNTAKDITIGNHVWIGDGVTVLKGAVIKDNSVVGTKSIVNKVFEEENVILAGIPAKIINRNVNWNKKNINHFKIDLESYEIEV